MTATGKNVIVPRFRSWAHEPVRQPANDRTLLWELAADHRSVWLRPDRFLPWTRHEFPLPLADMPALDRPVDQRMFNGARLGLAFDLQQMYGPWVDVAVGAEEPDVDRWEAGKARPTLDQARRAAFLTGFKVQFFYNPKPLPEITHCSHITVEETQ